MPDTTKDAQVLVFGGTGQVGQALIRTKSGLATPSRSEVDLTDSGAVHEAVARTKPRAIINAAAWTAVDAAEAEEDAALAVNGIGAGHIAEAAASRRIPLVHISTDYVFEGGGTRPWRPDDPVAPLAAYGRTKLDGERRVRAAGGTHAILRTSWVFSPDGGNFVKTMLRLAETRDRLTVVSDQVGGPTAAADIARTCLSIAEQLAVDPSKTGTYHFSGGPDVSWAEFARAIFDVAGCEVDVIDIPTSDYPTPAARPLNSRLDCSSLEDVFGIARPDWRTALRSVVEDILGKASSRKEADR